MAKKINTTLCIIGSGTTGLSAALYAYRANIDVVVLDGPVPGGSLTLTTAVENYPGIASITGPALMNSIRAQVLKPGVQIIAETATSVDFSKPPFKVIAASVTVKADAVIIACGAVSRSSPLTWSTTGPSAVTQVVEGIPTTAFLGGQVKLHSGGYIVTKPGRTQTSVSGVFAAGDVQDTRYKQAVTAAGSGVMAAIDAQEYLAAKPAVGKETTD